jgi:putative Holliday junction resolvase
MSGMHDGALHVHFRRRPLPSFRFQPVSSAPSDNHGTVLAFDFGEKRIGVAIGEQLLGIAHPLTTIHGEANDERFRAIGELIAQWEPVQLVVGLPLSLDGEEHAVTQLCRKFARRLNGRFNLPVALVDERLSSAEASQTLKQIGIGGRRQKPMLDQVAAQHILQSYFDSLENHDTA